MHSHAITCGGTPYRAAEGECMQLPVVAHHPEHVGGACMGGYVTIRTFDFHALPINKALPVVLAWQHGHTLMPAAHLQSLAARYHCQRVECVLMQAQALRARQEVGYGQQDADHEEAAKDALKADNLERLHGQVGHEKVLKRQLGSLHSLQCRHSGRAQCDAMM